MWLQSDPKLQHEGTSTELLPVKWVCLPLLDWGQRGTALSKRSWKKGSTAGGGWQGQTEGLCLCLLNYVTCKAHPQSPRKCERRHFSLSGSSLTHPEIPQHSLEDNALLGWELALEGPGNSGQGMDGATATVPNFHFTAIWGGRLSVPSLQLGPGLSSLKATLAPAIC